MEESAESTQFDPELRKKRGFGWCCAVFVRWVFILLFAVILIGGLYFKAPPKVLVLDGLLLALLTIVPKKKRKYGWLTLAAAVLAVTIWIFIPEKDSGDWKPYSFDEEIKAYNTKYAVPDEDNAAVILEEISLKYDDTFYQWPDFSNIEKPDDPNVAVKIIMQQVQARCADFYPDFWTDELDELTLYQPWKSKDYPELKDWLEQKNEDIKSLIDASKKPKCQFKYTFNPFPSSTFSDDPAWAINEWLMLLRRVANNDWADGRIDDAMEKYNAIFRLENLLSQQPLWSLAIRSMRLHYDIHKSLSRFIIENDFNKNQLNSLEETIVSIEEPDFEFLFQRWFEHQKLSMKQLWAVIYQINERGKTRHARSVPDKFWKPSFKTETPNAQFIEPIEKLAIFLSWFYVPATPQALSEQIDDAYDRISSISLEELKKENEIENRKLQLNFQFYEFGHLMHIQLGGCYGMCEKKELLKLYRNAFQIYIALRRYKNEYGYWPDRLEQLKDYTVEHIFMDPHNQSRLVYQNKGDDFILYSKGNNGIDEKGHFQRAVYGPNIMTKNEYYKLGPEKDDIKLWPIELEDDD